MILVLQILGRLMALLLVDAAYLHFLEHAPAGSGFDDPVGAGLAGFALLALAAAVLGLGDGWFLAYGRLALIWGLAAPLAATGMVVVQSFSYGGPEASMLAADLASLVPILTALILVPALLAAIGPWALRSADPARTTPGPRAAGRR